MFGSVGAAGHTLHQFRKTTLPEDSVAAEINILTTYEQNLENTNIIGC